MDVLASGLPELAFSPLMTIELSSDGIIETSSIAEFPSEFRMWACLKLCTSTLNLYQFVGETLFRAFGLYFVEVGYVSTTRTGAREAPNCQLLTEIVVLVRCEIVCRNVCRWSRNTFSFRKGQKRTLIVSTPAN